MTESLSELQIMRSWLDLFRRPKANQDIDIVVIVVGAAGAGKSLLINTAVGCNAVIVGHALKPCTKRVKSIPWDYQGRKIILVDTPALDGEECSGTTVTFEHLEKQLWKWMKDAKVQQVAGILHLHKITENRITAPSARTMTAFHRLCGANADASSRIILVTTMWDRIAPGTGDSREREIKAKYLAPGCRVTRFDKSADCVHRAVDLIIG